MTAVRCDLVIPVYNALRSTRDCLDSVRKYAPPWARVVVINDGSDSRTTEWLRGREGILLLENPVNLGFVKTANRGLLFSDAPYVCLLNSDTLLTEGALERMLDRMDADPAIALCCPLSNEAVNLSVKIPPGSDAFSFARRVARSSPALYPDAVTVVGFCLVFRRHAIRTLGVFDEVFGRGYCEETDYHYRCRAAGFRCVVADDTFVYHRHGASFSDRDARFAANVKVLMSRWGRMHEREIAAFDRRDALGAVRDGRHEWRLPAGDEPRADLLFLLSSLHSPAAPLVAPLANTLLLSGASVRVAVLDESGPGDSEMFFRPLVAPPERLRDVLPTAARALACDAPAAAALAIAAEGSPAMRIGLLEPLAPPEEGLRALYRARAGFDPRAAGYVLPLSPEPDLFYRRDLRNEARVRVACDDAALFRGSFETVSWIGLAREKRAALFGTSHVVVDLRPRSALAALEAMAAGAVPVVARGSDAEAFVRDGETGRLVTGPVEALEVVAALANDPGALARVARAAEAEARSRSWSATAGAFGHFVSSLAAPVPLEPESRALAERILESRPRPVPDAPAAAAARTGLRARLSRIRRRLLA